jgi:hypothetical protein
MRALVGFGLIALTACSGESESNSGTGGLAGAAGAGGSSGLGGEAGSGGRILIDTGTRPTCPAPHDPYQSPYLPPGCALSDATWEANVGQCGAQPATPAESLCDGDDPGPEFSIENFDVCAQATAAPEGHASWEWQHPIGISADCEHVVLTMDGTTLNVSFGGSGHVARWLAASGDPTRVQLEASVDAAGCTKRLRITYGCDYAEVVLAEVPAAGGQVSFGDQVLGKLAPDSAVATCANGPAALCAEISWPDLEPGELGCKVARTLPACGAIVQQCACKGGELEVFTGRASCGGPVRVGWYVDLQPYWRCL